MLLLNLSARERETKSISTDCFKVELKVKKRNTNHTVMSRLNRGSPAVRVTTTDPDAASHFTVSAKHAGKLNGSF